MVDDLNILTPESAAKFLKKSLSWIYKNKEKLGAVKLGGSLFFPSKEELYERIFRQKEKGVALRFRNERQKIHKSLLQDETGSSGLKSKTKGGGEKPETIEAGLKRHGLL